MVLARSITRMKVVKMLSKVALDRIETIKSCVDQIEALEDANNTAQEAGRSFRERERAEVELSKATAKLDSKIGKQWQRLSGDQQVEAWAALGPHYQPWVDGY